MARIQPASRRELFRFSAFPLFRFERQRHRGAVMMETVLVMPIILILLLFLLYYGLSLTNLQRASVQDRYEAWRMVHYGYGPRASGHDMTTHPVYAGTDQINETFWFGTAEAMSHRTSTRFPEDTRERMVDEARRASFDAGNYAEHVLYRELRHGRTVGLSTTFTYDSAYLQGDIYNSPVVHHHTRIGTEWKYMDGYWRRDDGQWIYAQPYHRSDPDLSRLGPENNGDAIRFVFLMDLDEPMRQATGFIASVVRSYYRQFPRYIGPDVDYQFPTN